MPFQSTPDLAGAHGTEREDDAGGCEHGGGEEQKSAAVVAGAVAEVAHERRIEDSAKDADHVDGGEARRRTTAFEEGAGHRKQRPLDGVVHQVHAGEDENRQPGRDGERHGGQADCFKKRGDD